MEDLLERIDRTLRHACYQTLIGVTRYYRAEEKSLLSEQLLHRPASLITCLGRSDSIDNLIAKAGEFPRACDAGIRVRMVSTMQAFTDGCR